MYRDLDPRKRKLRDRGPMDDGNPEHNIGHMGLGGFGDSRGLMEAELRQRHIQWITNAKIDAVRDGQMDVGEMDGDGQPRKTRTLPVGYAMVLPAVTGVDAVRGVEGLANPSGFLLADRHPSTPAWPTQNRNTSR